MVICLLLLETRVTHDVPCALEKIVMMELSEHVNSINIFKVINVCCRVNLTFFTLISIPSIRKKTKKPETWKQDGR